MSQRASGSPDQGLGWQVEPVRSRLLPGAYALLVDGGSLTRHLRAMSRDFRLSVQHQGLARPDRDAARLLGIRPGSRAWLRQVLLGDGDEPLVFAQTVVPRADLAAWPWLRGLAARPLGEVLFRHPRVERLPLRYRRLDCRHPLYHAALRGSGDRQREFWARRSLFRLAGAQLLVTEVFTPALLARASTHFPE